MSASTSVDLQPQTVELTLKAKPAGLGLSINTFSGAAPYTRTVIVGSANSLSAGNQTLNGIPYTFSSWSDGGVAAQNVIAPAIPQTTPPALHGPNIHRSRSFSAKPRKGPIPLTVKFNGGSSWDPDGDHLVFSWDLNGDGIFGDSHSIRPERVYKKHKKFTVGLRVRDGRGGVDTARTTIRARR